MRRLLLVALLLAGSLCAMAQFHLGIRSGFSAPYYTHYSEGKDLNGVKVESRYSSSAIVGIHVGAFGLYEVPIVDEFSLEGEGGVQFSRLGGSVAGVTTSLYYMQFPMRANAVYHLGELGSAGPASIMASIGPQIGIGLGGSMNQYTVEWGEGGMNRLNVDLSFHLGMRFSRIPLQGTVFYELGLTSYGGSKHESNTLNNVGISVAYLFF